MLTAALIETFIPTAIISAVTVHSAVGFDEMISRGDSYSTLRSPSHTLEAAVIWAVTRRFTASKDATFHAGHLLPSLRRCTRQAPVDPLPGTPPAKASPAAGTDTCSSSGSVSGLSIAARSAPSPEAAQAAPPALRTVKKTAPKSTEKPGACSYRQERAESLQAHSELTTDSNNR